MRARPMTEIEKSYATALKYEQKAARWLMAARDAEERGRKDQAEKLFAKCQYWFDKMNKALGNG